MNWIELKALHELYNNGIVRKNETLSRSSEIRFLMLSVNKLQETFREIHALEGYKEFYVDNYLDRFTRYDKFLRKTGILKPQSRFDLKDIEILITIHKGRQDGSLEFLREQIISANESLKGISLMFFKHEKYLLSRPSLIETLKKMLDVPSFAHERDQQYIYKLECEKPQAIILCENLDFLTKPNKPRKHRLELWYAGGKNIKKLMYADPRGLPIFYSCDWDYDGLLIYTWIKELLPSIQLLFPNGPSRSIIETEHDSLWKKEKNLALSGLPAELFDNEQVQLIQKLTNENTWIIEESNDIIVMLSKVKEPFFGPLT